MRHRKIMILLITVLILAVGAWTASAAGLVDQRAVLQGEVISFVPAGTHVEEGTELVRVSTLAGSATAARATVRGTVKEILVHQGGMIKNGDVVVRIQAE